MSRDAQTTDISAYFESRIERLRDLIVTGAEGVLDKSTKEQDKAFEQAIEGRLRNGAKFVPRKQRKSR
jgi:hypothetical protein